MSTTFPTGRSFERSTRNERIFPGKRDRSGRLDPREFLFEPLMRVAIRSNYYNASADRGRDFRISPTPASAALMADVGLLFKEDAAGFSILYDKNGVKMSLGAGQGENRLIGFLKSELERAEDNARFRGSPPDSEPGVWTRLSFILSVVNPLFVNQSKVDINLDPTATNLYYTNQEVESTSPPQDVNVLRREELPVSGTQVTVNAAGCEEVELLAISGEVVICIPRCVPRGLVRLSGNPAALTCRDVEKYEEEHPVSPPDLECRDLIYLDLSRLPEDRYAVHKELSPPDERSFVYSVSSPIPLAFVNLLLTRPLEGEPGVFPIRDLDTEPKIVPTDYEIRFQERATCWIYYIAPMLQTVVPTLHHKLKSPRTTVPTSQAHDFAGLRIEQYDPLSSLPPKETFTFGDPVPVRLADGRPAFRFVSEQEIPLFEQSPYFFRLYVGDKILINRLPVAGPQQILTGEQVIPSEEEIQENFVFPKGNYTAVYVYV